MIGRGEVQLPNEHEPETLQTSATSFPPSAAAVSYPAASITPGDGPLVQIPHTGVICAV